MYRTAAIVLGFATLSQPAAAEDPRFEALVQALLHRGDRVISSGEFHYILRVREQTPTDAEVQAQVAQIRATLRDQLRQHANNAEMASRIQTAIDTAGDYVPAQVHANADLQFQYYFAMEGPQLGGDRYMEISVFDRVASKYGDPRQVLIRSLGPTGGTSIDQNPQAGGMVILANGARDVYQPSQEPQRLGRANGSLATQLADLDATRIGDWLSTAVTDVAVTPLQTEPGVDAVEYKLTVNAK